MQLFNIDTAAGIEIKEEIRHIRFKDVSISSLPGKERDLEDLILRYPGLLDFGDFYIEDNQNSDLLIISRQPTTMMRKRADLLAIHRDGSLVVIEIKRDAIDERNRVEGMEFQAIRYAAASRKMSVEAIINTYTGHLYNAVGKHIPTMPDEIDAYRQLAIENLSEHLADEEEELDEYDLYERIDPKEDQKIYLVAADYEPDVISACAWLREHNIDISCFRLRPYRIASQIILERERLIPPPELDDLMLDVFTSTAASSQVTPKVARRDKGDKVISLVWSDNEGNELNISTWRALLEHVVRRALDEGVEPNNLPVKLANEDQFDKDNFSKAVRIEPHNIYIEVNYSAANIMKFVKQIVPLIPKQLSLRVETKNGSVYEFGRIGA